MARAVPGSVPVDTWVIEPRGEGLLWRLRELIHYRYLIGYFAWRTVSQMYRGTALRPLWLLMRVSGPMGLSAVIFGAVLDVPSEAAGKRFVDLIAENVYTCSLPDPREEPPPVRQFKVLSARSLPVVREWDAEEIADVVLGGGRHDAFVPAEVTDGKVGPTQATVDLLTFPPVQPKAARVVRHEVVQRSL